MSAPIEEKFDTPEVVAAVAAARAAATAARDQPRTGIDARHMLGTGTAYYGEIKDNRYDGYGAMKIGDHCSYEGAWREGRKHGLGVLRGDEDAYEGDWRFDRFDGHGVMTYASGRRHAGAYREHFRHGPGAAWRHDGALEQQGWWWFGTFVGARQPDEWGLVEQAAARGRASAAAAIERGAAPAAARKLTLVNGSYYGEVNASGRMHGHGQRVWRFTGVTYRGEFDDGAISGVGECRFAKGDVYAGQWREGRPEGVGVWTYADATRFEGQFRAGKRHGAGVLLSDGEPPRCGWWRDGVYCGRDIKSFA